MFSYGQEQDDETRLVAAREAESSTPNRLRRRSCGEWTQKAWLRGFGGAVGCELQPQDRMNSVALE